MFTKRRKAIRQKQEEDRKRWEENSKKFDKGCEDTIKTCKYIQEHHPEFDSLDGEERVKLFAKTLKEISNG
jgi:hypothetical protein